MALATRRRKTRGGGKGRTARRRARAAANRALAAEEEAAAIRDYVDLLEANNNTAGSNYENEHEHGALTRNDHKRIAEIAGSNTTLKHDMTSLLEKRPELKKAFFTKTGLTNSEINSIVTGKRAH